MINKKILLIGGTGALGKSLIHLYQKNNYIKVFSRDEHKQVNLINGGFVSSNVSFLIGDVKDKNSLFNAIEDFKPEVIINTAALKHVPVCEINPFESVNVNIIGHQNLLEVVRRSSHKIETLIYISSDKACKPINIYGMCKAISERLYIEFAKKTQSTKVCLVRYGNVLESTGSVIPYFKKLLNEKSEYLPITHENMTRFLLTLNQAAQLIDWSYYNENSHGKIAVPKINSFRIVDIAKSLIKNHYGDENYIPLKFIGVRKGEKIHEEMISNEEWMRTIESDNYLITDEIINNDFKSYNSKDSVMDSSIVYEFLKSVKVI
jgi:FlaA1/EpsC-like NDP-sugar epimerase